jgi:hypothetical protein
VWSDTALAWLFGKTKLSRKRYYPELGEGKRVIAKDSRDFSSDQKYMFQFVA